MAMLGEGTIFIDPKVWACGHKTPLRFIYAVPAIDGIWQFHSGVKVKSSVLSL